MAAITEIRIPQHLPGGDIVPAASLALSEKEPLLSIVEQQEDAIPEPVDDNLIVSPYEESSHLLALSSVSPECQLLARALTVMRSVRSDYATAPYTDAFNWADVYERLQTLVRADGLEWTSQRRFYIVVFRSQIPPSTSRGHLGVLDQRSHAEAMDSGGLLKYWFGKPDEEGRNLATCKSMHWRLGVANCQR